MPKGKASVSTHQAGAAAVPTSRAKESEYEHLCALFSRALHRARAGTDLRAEADCLWRTCRSLDPCTQNVAAITSMALHFLRQAPQDPPASNLTMLFLQRILLLAGMFDVMLQQLSQQQKLADRNLHGIILMLMIMLGGTVGLDFKVPPELQPSPGMSPVALAPKLWTPHTLTAACRALLSSSDGGFKKYSKTFIYRIRNPSTSIDVDLGTKFGDSVASRADLDLVLRDSNCMHAVWKVLEHCELCSYGVHILEFLVTRAKATGPGCPASLTHLLQMGAEKPLTVALTHHYKAFEEEQQQQQEQGMPCLDDTESHLGVLFMLLMTMDRASLEDRQGFYSCDRLKEVPWPGALVQAHLLALIKVIDIEHLCPDFSLTASYIDLLMTYPPASRATAASVLAGHPEYLHKLVSFLGQVAAAIPTAKTDAIKACSQFSVAFSLLVEAGGQELQQVLPIELIIASSTAALQNTAKQLMQPPLSLQTIVAGSPQSVHCIEDQFSLHLIAVLLHQVLNLPGITQQHAICPIFVLDVAHMATFSGALVSLSDLAMSDPLDGAAGAARQGVERTCLACGKRAIKKHLKCCLRCQESWFCDRQYQLIAWPYHKKTCMPSSD